MTNVLEFEYSLCSVEKYNNISYFCLSWLRVAEGHSSQDKQK